MQSHPPRCRHTRVSPTVIGDRPQTNFGTGTVCLLAAADTWNLQFNFASLVRFRTHTNLIPILAFWWISHLGVVNYVPYFTTVISDRPHSNFAIELMWYIWTAMPIQPHHLFQLLHPILIMLTRTNLRIKRICEAHSHESSYYIRWISYNVTYSNLILS